MNRSLMSQIKCVFSGLKREQRPSFFWLSVLYAGYFLFFNIFLHVNHGINEWAEFLIFIHGWMTVPILTILAVSALEYLRQRSFKENQAFYPVVLLANLLCWVIALWGLRLLTIKTDGCLTLLCVLNALDQQIPSWQTGQWTAGGVSFYFWQGVVLIFILIHVLALATIKLMGGFLTTDYTSRKLSDILWGVLFVGLGLIGLNFSGFRFEKFFLFLASALFALLSIFHKKMISFQPTRTGMRVMTAICTLAIIFLVFDPGFAYDRHHQNHLLGPVTDLLNGKSPLVDINCQYGVLIIYFLKLAFSWLPFSYQGFNLLVTVTYAGLYLGLYAFLRYLLRSVVLAIATLCLIIMTHFFATMGEAGAYPSIGPLRFGLPYLILFLTMVPLRYPHARRLALWLEGAVLALASAWSFETCVYTTTTYLAIAVYEGMVRYQNIRQLAVSMLERLASVSVLGLCLHLWVAFDIQARSGQWPHGSYYVDYLFLYSTVGFGSMVIAPWSPWLWFIMIPLVSLFIIFYTMVWSGSKNCPPEFSLVSGLCGLAIGQFTYFLGRSHPNNLFHISIPIICLAAFWLFYAGRQEGNSAKKFYPWLIYGGYVAAFFLFFNILPQTIKKIQAKIVHYGQFQNNFASLLTRKPTNGRVAEAVFLVDKYARDKSRIAIFISADDTTEVLMLTQKTHVFPFNYALQANLLAKERERVVNFVHPLKEGDIIFVSKDYSDLQARVVFRLQKQFRFVPREIAPSGMVAFELRRS